MPHDAVMKRFDMTKTTWTLMGRDGQPYQSAVPGTLGGHRGGKLYGRFDCRAALQAIVRGGYARRRVFFLDEDTAIAAGYRPCAVCLPEAYAAWKANRPAGAARKRSTKTMTAQAALLQDPDQHAANKQASPGAPDARIAALDWRRIEETLTRDGYAILPTLLTPDQCREVAGYFTQEERFRSRIVMERYAFGRGEYKYFSYPLPDLVAALRTALYPHLAPVANRWHAAMRMDERFPATHAEFRGVCHRAGQQRPTPLLLRYRETDYCCLHQDLYGEHVFPFQAVFLLDEPGRDFDGGELLLTESDPKKPGRAEVVPLRQGQAVVFAVNSRPVRSTRGFYRVNLRHGVSQLQRGQRHTLGIIFHDAR